MEIAIPRCWKALAAGIGIGCLLTIGCTHNNPYGAPPNYGQPGYGAPPWGGTAPPTVNLPPPTAQTGPLPSVPNLPPPGAPSMNAAPPAASTWANPGTMSQQQQRATVFDPYADNGAGPEIVGGRPREFQKPLPDPVRAGGFRDTRWPF